MLKKVILGCFLIASFASCTDESSSSDTAAVAAVASDETPLDETNLYGRANRGMAKLMMHYDKAAGVIDGFSKPRYTMDKKCNVVFSYEENGIDYEKRFNMSDLEHRNNKMSLQADDGIDILYPGFKIKSANDEPIVEIYKNGDLISKDNEWYIILADREAVQKAVPNMVNVINICQEINGKK